MSSGAGEAAARTRSRESGAGARRVSDRVDPITLEVVVEGLIAIVREMRATVIRASYSSVIWELDDFSCAIFDAQAQMI
ncbi:MAG: hydantoinase B/oxoprolinase family protein, partial [Candidatus Rokubacteria bacterium]|nr:hydantoinase B/oxoprolinase family protein [Candidatus Rokubacteria bacterium]